MQFNQNTSSLFRIDSIAPWGPFWALLNLLNLNKKASAVASPLSMLAGPEAAPIAAALGAYAGSGKQHKKAKSVKKNVDLAAQIVAIVAQSQGYEKEAHCATWDA